MATIARPASPPRRMLVSGNTIFSLWKFRRSLLLDLVRRGFEVHVSAGNYENIGSNTSTILEDIQSEGIRYHPLPILRAGLNPFFELHYFLSYLRLCREIKPHLVLNYTIKPVIWGSLAAACARVDGIYSMITGLGYVFTGYSFKQKLLRLLIGILYKLSLPFNKAVYFQNGDDLDLFVQNRYLNRAKGVLIAGSGVELDKFLESPLPTTKPLIFICVARMLKDKGIGELIAASENLKSEGFEFECLLVGDVDKNPSSIDEHHLRLADKNGTVRWLSHQEDVASLLRASHVFVLPSYREGLPRSTLEALSVGRPILTTDVPGCRDTVNERNGVLCKARDAEDLARAMRLFLGFSPSVLSAMGDASRALARSRFDVKLVNQSIFAKMRID